MASTETETAIVSQQPQQHQQQQVVKKQKKLKPARKQVAPGQVEKKEAPQTGKEYSSSNSFQSISYAIPDALSEKIFGTTNGPGEIEKTATQSTS
jgi:hypothetical protein